MRELAKLILTVLALAQAAGMFAVELNRTHVTNPIWPGHARFHLVWQNLTTALLSALTVGLIWWPYNFQAQRFLLAAILTSIPLIGFIGAYRTRHLYRGTLSDPNGVPPLRFFLGGQLREFDGNTLAVVLGFVTLSSSLAIFFAH